MAEMLEDLLAIGGLQRQELPMPPMEKSGFTQVTRRAGVAMRLSPLTLTEMHQPSLRAQVVVKPETRSPLPVRI